MPAAETSSVDLVVAVALHPGSFVQVSVEAEVGCPYYPVVDSGMREGTRHCLPVVRKEDLEAVKLEAVQLVLLGYRLQALLHMSPDYNSKPPVAVVIVAVAEAEIDPMPAGEEVDSTAAEQVENFG